MNYLNHFSRNSLLFKIFFYFLRLAFYFIFEDTEVFITFPYKYYWKIDSVSSFLNYDSNPSWCTDKNGNIINYYKYKCRVFYRDIKNSKTVKFDNNIEDQNTKTMTDLNSENLDNNSKKNKALFLEKG